MNLVGVISLLLTSVYTTTDFNRFVLILFLIYTNKKERNCTNSRYINIKMEVTQKTGPCSFRYSVHYGKWLDEI